MNDGFVYQANTEQLIQNIKNYWRNIGKGYDVTIFLNWNDNIRSDLINGLPKDWDHADNDKI